MVLSPHHRSLDVLLLSAAAAVACTRYEYVNELDLPECKNRPAPVLAIAGAVTHDSASSAWFHGLVVRMDSGEPLRDAQVWVFGADSSLVLTDSSGQFAFTGTPRQGPVHVDVRRIGFARYSDTVIVPLAPGLGWRVGLAVMATDGPCSGFATVRVRKPWWKFW